MYQIQQYLTLVKIKIWGELRSYINMWSEANDMAGETAFAAAFKEAIAGNPVNYQREGRKFLFESILAEDDARYHETC